MSETGDVPWVLYDMGKRNSEVGGLEKGRGGRRRGGGQGKRRERERKRERRREKELLSLHPVTRPGISRDSATVKQEKTLLSKSVGGKERKKSTAKWPINSDFWRLNKTGVIRGRVGTTVEAVEWRGGWRAGWRRRSGARMSWSGWEAEWSENELEWMGGGAEELIENKWEWKGGGVERE